MDGTTQIPLRSGPFFVLVEVSRAYLTPSHLSFLPRALKCITSYIVDR